MLALGRAWATAPQCGDADALDHVTTQGSTLVGPRGYVLDEHQWLERYRSRALVTHSLSWTEVQGRSHGSAVITIGVQAEAARYHDRPADGSFRITHIAVRRAQRWLLADSCLTLLDAPAVRPERGAQTAPVQQAATGATAR